MTARRRDLAVQGAVVLLLAGLLALVALQAAANLRERGIASGFGYLRRVAGFEIAPGPVPYTSRDTYAHALGVALVNTLRVSLLAAALASPLGLAVGVARLAKSRATAWTAGAYVEVLRNTPLLLQLFCWAALFRALPPPTAALHPLPGVFVCDRGLFLPGPSGAPALDGFDIRGGLSIAPEFGALLLCLATSTAAFLGEIVRGAILSVGRGQTEAALALGLSRARTLRLVVLPQALRVMVPPATTQFLAVAKNSSLGVAIGYPELISITNSTQNQTGQAIEAIAVAMSLYLAISLGGSLALHVWQRRRR